MKQIWKETAKRLEKIYDRREAENITYLLLEDVFDISRSDILAEVKIQKHLTGIDEYIDRLLNGEPIQYVTGVADFYGRKFHIARGALIPRPETEELCEAIIQENDLIKPKVMDVGVGSGCIAITLANELKGEVFGTDVSREAIAIASKNARKLEADVAFSVSDILKEDLPESNLDILVSNPPYIPLSDQKEMRENVLDFEPSQALFVPDEDPILFYKRIAKKGLDHLKKGGKLYFEIHENFGNEVKNHLQKVGYTDVILHKDMQGKDRMISATNSASR
ncbi:MAG: peptide chain release factor N(5)-glutamine methyltransferase [Ekhidna sp.]